MSSTNKVPSDLLLLLEQLHSPSPPSIEYTETDRQTDGPFDRQSGASEVGGTEDEEDRDVAVRSQR